jgi:glycosyltransferase involved in cell wall biosynthesis
MISIAMPTYESFGRGTEFLDFQFQKFREQTYKDFEVVISDHSKDDNIENLCKKYDGIININYARNEENRGNFTDNTNRAMKRCNGDIIKILFQDDFLLDHNSLEKINNAFDENTNWLITACEHTYDGTTLHRTHHPTYNELIYTGKNTIGNPSVLSVRNKNDMLFFDERMLWTVDVDYYKRLHDKFGPPTIINDITVVIRLWDRQLTHLIPPQRKQREVNLSIEKHGKHKE